MLGSARCSWAFGFLLAACGGQSTSSGGGETSDGGTSGGGQGTSGSSPVASGGRDLTDSQPSQGSAAAAPSASSAGMFSSGGGPDCPSLPGECAAASSSVVIDGMPYDFPSPGSCGVCTSSCVECAPSCVLPITAAPHCTRTTILLSVCSTLGGQERCLNTYSDDPYFVDAVGKTWSVVQLTADDSLAFRKAGAVETTLSLTVTDGVSTAVYAVKVRACNTENLRLLPC